MQKLLLTLLFFITISNKEIKVIGAKVEASNKAIDLIKKFEGFKPRAYKDSVGVWTVGYGTTRGVNSDVYITKEIAHNLMILDLKRFEDYVNSFNVEFTQNQFDALVSLAYNVGKFGKGLRNAILTNLRDVPNWILKYNKAGGVILKGLERRRKAEAELYES